jgi:hypothetical protein
MSMQPPTPPARTALRYSTASQAHPRKRDDLAYQAVTVAAILLVLCTLWLF